ncbi:MAG: carboxypeptidase regulatory-like domain-containing protein [Rhodothermales bacterium]
MSDKKYVRGFVLTQLRPDLAHEPRDSVAHEIYLPGVSVFLRNPSTGADVDSVLTDLSGRFDFPPQDAGDYLVCWERDGFNSGCLPDPITVDSRPVNIGDVRIGAITDQGTRVSIYGTVSLRDGSSIRFLEPVVSVNNFVKVQVLDLGDTVLYETALNNFGRYVIPSVPADSAGHLQVVASIDQGRAARSIRGEKLITGVTHRVNITMRNSSPKIEDVISSVGGVEMIRPNPGDVVDLVVRSGDPDGDPLEYTWRIDRGSGMLSATTGSTVQWTLPNTPGLYSVYVHVTDRKGGYDRQVLKLSTGSNGEGFSGQVLDVLGAPVAGAEVAVGDGTATTNSNGYFSARVTRVPRYVLNIRRQGFAPVSRIYRAGISGGRWTMRPVTVTSIDPTIDNTIADSVHQQIGCAIPASSRIDWDAFGTRKRVRIQDGRGRVVAIGDSLESPFPASVMNLRRERGCGPGGEVFIPANSIVDDDGNVPPSGTMVDVAIGTVDLLEPNSMPGDYSALNAAGEPRTMDSFGAVFVELSAGGESYNIEPGANAGLRIPVPDVQLTAPGSIPTTIPQMIYDETAGLWRTDGTMTLDASGQFYEGQVGHFTTINADVLKDGQSCVRFKSEGLPTPYRIEVVVPMGGGSAPRVRDEQIDENGVYHLIINLPNDTDITLMPYAPVGDGGVPYGVFGVNTNGPQSGNPTGPNYAECETKVVLFEVDAPEPGADAFLHGLYSLAASRVQEGDVVLDQTLKDNLEDATIDYYGTIDPRGLRKTFTEFKQTNGFAPDGNTLIQESYGPVDEVRAAYANAVDLGFGRDMHGKRTLANDNEYDIAFYVTNYGSYESDDEGDFENAVTQNSAELVATVAMEWSRIEDPAATPYNYYDPDAGADPNDPNAPIVISDNERVVKFYVYDAAGNPLFTADLDNRGARPIPQLCMVCHGGAYDAGFNTGVPAFSTPADVKMGAVMLPFDVNTYVLDGAVPLDFEETNQHREFFELNDLVVDTEPGAVIEEIIDEMYTGSDPDPIEDFLVTNWDANDAHRDMYLNVVGPACRVCHASRPLEDNGSGGVRDIRFQDVNQFLKPEADGGIAQKADLRVCTQRVMPHALATYNRFWSSYDSTQPAIFPFGPTRLTAFFDAVVEPTLALSGLGENCVEEPTVEEEDVGSPAATLTLVQNEILTNACAVCHNDPPNFTDIDMDLSSGLSHISLVDVDAEELNSGKRVAPSDPAASYVIDKIENANLSSLDCANFPQGDARENCGENMPPPNGGLTATDIDDIKEWISNGAQDN